MCKIVTTGDTNLKIFLNPGAGGGITFDAKALLSKIKKNHANFENSHYPLNP